MGHPREDAVRHRLQALAQIVRPAVGGELAQRQQQGEQDQLGGVQYASVAFGDRLREAGVLPSMGSMDDAYDNAMAESFVAMLKTELLPRQALPTRDIARVAIFECFYNPHRRHSSLGYASPIEYERSTMTRTTAA